MAAVYRVAGDGAKQAVYGFCAELALAVAVAGAVAAGSAVVVELGDLVGVRTTQQGHGPAVLDDGGGELAFVVVAHVPCVLEDGVVSGGRGGVRGQGFWRRGGGLLGVEGRAVPSPGADERACVEPGVRMTDSARLSEHIAGGFVRRGGVVVEVSVDASRLLQEPGDVLYVWWGDIVVGQLLCC
jgi:hypothetical protein